MTIQIKMDMHYAIIKHFKPYLTAIILLLNGHITKLINHKILEILP